MAPSGNTTKSTSSRTRTRKQRRTQSKKKKQPQQSKNQELSISAVNNDISKMEDINPDEVITSDCSTPKAERFRIPEILTCPPAPKKPRVVSNCSLLRSPISFYAPPELELFFFSTLRDISV